MFRIIFKERFKERFEELQEYKSDQQLVTLAIYDFRQRYMDADIKCIYDDSEVKG